jgi:hypothetical protein
MFFGAKKLSLCEIIFDFKILSLKKNYNKKVYSMQGGHWWYNGASSYVYV